MAKKVRDVLLVSNPYDAFIMEEDGRLSGRIIHEYHGLNLSRPPRLTWVSTGRDALAALSKTGFDIVIIMPRLDDMESTGLGAAVKARFPHLPVFLLTHAPSPALVDAQPDDVSPFDKMYVWQGSTDLLLALIKNVEDRMNVAVDTRLGRVPVILLVEDDPLFTSAILPLLYREIVLQTQRVMEESINDEHRLLHMRARPKLLIAETYEKALQVYREFEHRLLCIISDVRFPKNGKMDNCAGVSLLRMIRREHSDIALLNLSSNEENREAALSIPAVFLNKHASTFLQEIRNFFIEHLGFGEFVFRSPDGKEVCRAKNIRGMEKILPQVPEDVLVHHASKNHFSTWLRARAEIELADRIRPVNVSDFQNARDLRDYIIRCLSEYRRDRQKGAVIDFSENDFDPESDFVKMGNGSLGGKARGLAFVSTLLRESDVTALKFPHIHISIPKTLVITTDGFDMFMENANLQNSVWEEADDDLIEASFLSAPFPEVLRRDLGIFLSEIRHPLAVRSSSLLEDSLSHPFAGIYQTFMTPNAHPDLSVRLDELITAIKRVFASVFLKAARRFSENTHQSSEPDKMAVIIQQVVGSRHGNFFYPAVSGIAHSYNFYPAGHMKREEGVACIALGLGKTVVDGSGGLRFSPKHPELLPGFSTVDEILKNAQRRFYALRLDKSEANTDALVQLSIEDAASHFPVSYLSSRYIPEEHRIRTTGGDTGYPVLTFDSILKRQDFPLDQILTQLLEIGRKGMGGAVEMEFAIDFSADKKNLPVFAILQLRPSPQVHGQKVVSIDRQDLQKAICTSETALGNGRFEDIEDIVYVDPEAFEPSKTLEIARHIGKIGRSLQRDGRKYMLIGPGRWGSADPFLGIPVRWEDISGAGIIIETASEKMRATPSQGSHFFHNIIARGIGFITIKPGNGDKISWEWLNSLPEISKTAFVRHVRATPAPVIKIDGKTSRAVIHEQ